MPDIYTGMPSASIMDDIGSTGLLEYGGYVQEDSRKDMWGLRGIRQYKEMADTDPVVGAVLFGMEMLIRKVTWRVEPFSEDEQHLNDAQFVDEALHDMASSFEDTLSEVITFLPYGWSYMNTVYKRRNGVQNDEEQTSRFNDGKIAWKKWSLRAQDSLLRWEFDPDNTGRIRGMWQQPLNGPLAYIPVEAALHFRTTARKGNPEGRSILSNAVDPYKKKKKIQILEGIGIERDLAGLPVAWAPAEIMQTGASPEHQALYNALKKIVTGIRNDDQAGVVWPLQYDEAGNKKFDLTLLTTGGSRQFQTDPIIARYDQRIAMVALADFILLGHEQVGSFALASSKTTLFGYALGAFLDAIADVVNRQAIPRLFRLNGMATDALPKLVHGDVESVDLAELGSYVTAITGAGVILDAKAQEFLLDQGQIPHDKTTQDGEV